MPRMKETKRAELEAFWRSHLEGWAASDLNQREYCEAHGLPLKRFGNWRAKFRYEVPSPVRRLLYRRGGSFGHMASHMADREIDDTSTGYVPSAATMPDGRRNFRVADKKRMVAEAMAPGASVSGVARRYGIDTRLLFRWKREFARPPSEPVSPLRCTRAILPRLGCIDMQLRSWLFLLAPAAVLASVIGPEVGPQLSGCNIKGNISYNTGERIYHVPGQEHYVETVITLSKGERWFCSETAAREAGWRKARR